jgi:SAM-dependent methyltransferase
VLRATLEDSPFPESAFDVVVSFDVIEHVRNPIDFLKSVYCRLRPGGRVFLCTPSLDSPVARLMGRHWMEYKVEHLYYFSNPAMSLALRQAGFRLLALLPNRKVLSVDYIYHHFMRFRNPALSPLIRSLRSLIPGRLAHRPLRLVDSNMFAVAERPGS